MQPVKLTLGRSECALQLVPFGDRVAGMVCDDDGLLRMLANRTNGQPAGSGNANDGRACSLGSPALNTAARSWGELLFWLISKTHGDGGLQSVQSGRCIRTL